MTILGQLPFMLFTEIAQTWVVQRDSVNTVIMHSYLTLPRYTEITGIYKVIRQIGFVRVGRIWRQMTEPAGSEELKPILKKIDVGCPKLSCAVCPTLTRPIFCYAHLVPKGPETIRRKTLGHSINDIIGCGYLLETDFPWNDAVPNEVIWNVDMHGGVMVNRIFWQSNNTLTIAVDN